jgi:hypothetical protein
MGALTRLVALVRRPAPTPGPSGLVVVELRRKHCVDGGPVLNCGEVVGLSPMQAARLIRTGAARPCGPNATSTVRPREDDTREYRRAGLPMDSDSAFAPSDSVGETIFEWPPTPGL